MIRNKKSSPLRVRHRVFPVLLSVYRKVTWPLRLETMFFSLMTPRYKYRDRYFNAVIPLPTREQSTTHSPGSFLGMGSLFSLRASRKRARKTLASAFLLNRYLPLFFFH